MRRLQTVVLTSLLAIFLSQPALARTSENEMLVQAKQHLQNHRYAFATTWFERLLKSYPASSHRKEVLLLMSQAYVASDREEKAAEALRTLLKENPEQAKTLDAKLLELAKREPKPIPQPVEAAAAPAPAVEQRAPIPIIEPAQEPPQEPLVEPGNIYSGAALADNAKDVSETAVKSALRKKIEPVKESQPDGSGAEPPAAKKARKVPTAAAAATTVVQPVVKAPSATEPTSTAAPGPRAKEPAPAQAAPAPAAQPGASAASKPAAPPAAAAPRLTSVKRAAASPPAGAADQSAAAEPVKAPSATPAPRPASTSPAAAVPPPPIALSVVLPAVPEPRTPSAKAGNTVDKGRYVLKLGEDLLASQVPDLKKKLQKGGLVATVLEGPKKKMSMLRLQAEGVTDQESARKKLEEIRQAAGAGMILIGKDGKQRVYAGSYASEKMAEKEQQRLAALGIRCSLQKTVVPVPTYSVTTGRFTTRQAALEEETKLEKDGVKAVVVEMPR